MKKENNTQPIIFDNNCPKCNNKMIVKDAMFFWRGKYLSGLVCETCNALYDNPNDSFMDYVKNCEKNNI
jgi:DNA-directed RNA polymerase subunit M/transcription elongation factor TFIIS